MGAGISPFDELDKTRQRIRDNLQLARNAADTAENAQHVLKDAEAELEKIKQSRDELTKYHQEALFNLQNSKSEETRIENEIRTQDEIINSLKRELIAQIIPFGYKNLPDKNSDVIVKDLEERLKLWQDGVLKRDNLERNMTLANNNMADFKKDYDNAKNKCSELSNRLKTLEAERDAMQQQRIILFASKDPDTENNKMSRDVEDLKARSDERRELKIAINKKLDDIMSNLHALETELSTGRDELQKNEINFGKKLLTLGFKNEDDYLSACLNDDERKNLQERLKELGYSDERVTVAETFNDYETTVSVVGEALAVVGRVQDAIDVVEYHFLGQRASAREAAAELMEDPVGDAVAPGVLIFVVIIEKRTLQRLVFFVVVEGEALSIAAEM